MSFEGIWWHIGEYCVNLIVLRIVLKIVLKKKGQSSFSYTWNSQMSRIWWHIMESCSIAIVVYVFMTMLRSAKYQ